MVVGRGSTHVVNSVAPPRRAKGLDGKHLTLLHLGLVAVLDERDGLAAVDVPLLDVVASDVAHGLDAVRLTADLDLVALHDFLDGGADVADAHVDAGGLGVNRSALTLGTRVRGEGRRWGVYPHARVGGVLDCGQQVVVGRVKGHGEGAVEDPAVDVHAKVNSQDILLLQHDRLLARIGGVVGDLVVEAQSRGEAHARLEAISGLQAGIVQKRPHAVLDAGGEVVERVAGLGCLLHPASGLAVDFSRLAVVVEKGAVVPMLAGVGAMLGGGGACCGLVGLDLTLGVVARRKDGGQRDARGRRLLDGRSGPALLLGLLLVALLALLLGGSSFSGRGGYFTLVAVAVPIAVALLSVAAAGAETAISIARGMRSAGFSATNVVRLTGDGRVA